MAPFIIDDPATVTSASPRDGALATIDVDGAAFPSRDEDETRADGVSAASTAIPLSDGVGLAADLVGGAEPAVASTRTAGDGESHDRESRRTTADRASAATHP